MNDFVELTKTIMMVFRYWWVLVLSTVIALIIGGLITLSTTPVYEARTTVAVGRFIDAEDLGNWYLDAGEKLTLTYVNIARREPVIQGVINELELAASWQSLREQISVSVIEGTQLVEITTTNTDPVLAIDITAEVARQLALQAPDPLPIDPLNTQQTPVSPNENQLKIIEPAFIDTGATTPNLTLNLAVFGFIGIALGLLTILLISLFDQTIRTVDDLKTIPNLAVLGVLTPSNRLISNSSLDKKERQLSEMFQVLRSRISIRQQKGQAEPILITTPLSKTNTLPIATNLAIAFANTGQETILIDTHSDLALLDQQFSLEPLDRALFTDRSDDESLAPAFDLFEDQNYSNLKLIKPSGAESRVWASPARPNIPHLINQLTTTKDQPDSDILNVDRAIINGAALLDSPMTDFMSSLSSYALLIVQAGVNKVDDIRSAVDCLKQLGIKEFDVVLLKNSNNDRLSLQNFPFFNSPSVPKAVMTAQPSSQSYAQESTVADEALQGGD
ncbi:MAG: Wzz/FepE/Etk N-terminal domain-containing protein [Chloroflexota bacterium]